MRIKENGDHRAIIPAAEAALDQMAARPTMGSERRILLGMSGSVARRLALELDSVGRLSPITVASTYAQLRDLTARCTPGVIVLDHQILDEVPLVESVHQFAAMAPVILLAPLQHQALFATLAAAGNLDVVAREGNSIPLVAGLVERRIRWAEESPDSPPNRASRWPEGMGEIFRHEINNPLTGILGNAELLLSHREGLSTADTQRLQIVVDLAVRLRETIRKLSNSWEMQARPMNPS